MPNPTQSETNLERWTLPGACGSEQWQRSAGQFTSVLVGNKRLVAADQPFDLDQLQLRLATCGHAGPWPHAFQHCPECGSLLSDSASLPPSGNWSPPAGAPNGLMVSSNALSPVAATRRQEEMPRSANLSFIVAGKIPHLFAYDLQTGGLYARNELTSQWQDLMRLPASQALPRWSWSAALVPLATPDSLNEGFAVPTDQGPVFVRTGPATSLLLHPAALSLGIRSAAGGMTCLRGRPVAPVHLAGGLGLARLSASGDEWELVPVSQGDAVPPHTIFAAPVMHADDAFWCAPTGQLSVSLTGESGWQAEWQQWPEGLSPLLGVRPLQEQNGTMHQLMRRGVDELVFRATPFRVLLPWLGRGRVRLRHGPVRLHHRRSPWVFSVWACAC